LAAFSAQLQSAQNPTTTPSLLRTFTVLQLHVVVDNHSSSVNTRVASANTVVQYTGVVLRDGRFQLGACAAPQVLLDRGATSEPGLADTRIDRAPLEVAYVE
jgi:hypothetical protein